jgi:hypothetical protein
MQLLLDLNFAWAGGSRQKHLDNYHIFPCRRKVTSFAHATHEKTKTFFLSGLAVIAQTHGPLYKMLKNKLHRCTAAVSPMAALAGLSREQGHTREVTPSTTKRGNVRSYVTCLPRRVWEKKIITNEIFKCSKQ